MVLELVVRAPDLSAEPEEVIAVAWGTGPGEISLGEGDFGKGGPDIMAVSPDGKTIAVYDQYSDTRSVNFYSVGGPAGEVSLKAAPEAVQRGPMAIAVSNDREVYALYQTQPVSPLYHFADSGEVLEIIPIDGSLDPADLIWVGSSLYALAGVGGTDADGYLPVLGTGGPVSFPDQGSARAAIEQDYPLTSGHAALKKDPSGGSLLTLMTRDGAKTEVRLTLPPELANGAAFLYGSAFDGIPVIMVFSSSPSDGGASIGEFVAVDAQRGRITTATVRFDWKVPGGKAVVGPDAVIVMRLDFATGMQLLRVPFE